MRPTLRCFVYGTRQSLGNLVHSWYERRSFGCVRCLLLPVVLRQFWRSFSCRRNTKTIISKFASRLFTRMTLYDKILAYFIYGANISSVVSCRDGEVAVVAIERWRKRKLQTSHERKEHLREEYKLRRHPHPRRKYFAFYFCDFSMFDYIRILNYFFYLLLFSSLHSSQFQLIQVSFYCWRHRWSSMMRKKIQCRIILYYTMLYIM